jgi:hypothetical protein
MKIPSRHAAPTSTASRETMSAEPIATTARSTEKHRLYYGNKVQGSIFTPFARCTCGALVYGQAAIDEHQLLTEAKKGNY